jgi:nitroreductase
LELFDVMFHCRAMRRIRPDPLPESLILELIEAANQAPTAGNAQPGRWLIVRDPALRATLADFNRKAIDVSYPKPVPGAKMTAFRWQYLHLQDIPVHLIACVQLRPGRAATFQHGLAAGGSIWPAVQNLLLAARARELGACPTTLPLGNRDAVRELLALPEDILPVCLVPIGYPKGRFGTVTRRPVREIVRFDRWAAAPAG